MGACSGDSKPPRIRGPRRIAQHAGAATRERGDDAVEVAALRIEGKRIRGDTPQAERRTEMRVVVAAVIERSDRRLLIGQRRRTDSSPLKWEFPGGKVEQNETPEAALARELKEELGATLQKSVS